MTCDFAELAILDTPFWVRDEITVRFSSGDPASGERLINAGMTTIFLPTIATVTMDHCPHANTALVHDS